MIFHHLLIQLYSFQNHSWLIYMHLSHIQLKIRQKYICCKVKIIVNFIIINVICSTKELRQQKVKYYQKQLPYVIFHHSLIQFHSLRNHCWLIYMHLSHIQLKIRRKYICCKVEIIVNFIIILLLKNWGQLYLFKLLFIIRTN